MPQDQSTSLPATVVVSFVSIWNDDGPASTSMPSQYTVAVPLATANPPGLAPGTVGFSGSKILHDTARALFAHAAPTVPTNAAALTTLATQVASDFYAWRLLQYDKVLSGVVNWAIDGIADVEWSYLPDSCLTRASSWPRDGEPEELCHSDGADPTDNATWHHIVLNATIGNATSATQMVSVLATVYTEDYAGALTATSQVIRVWNKATTGGGATSGSHAGVSKSAAGKWIISWAQCALLIAFVLAFGSGLAA